MLTRRGLLAAGTANFISVQGTKADDVKQHVRVGVLMPTAETDPEASRRLDAFRRVLFDLGWKDSKRVDITVRYAGGDPNKAADDARSLVKEEVDVIVTAGTEASKAAQLATRSIPIVMASIGDPVGIGLVQSLSRPGGNITGFSLFASVLSSKRIEYALQCVPTIRRLAIIGNMSNDSVSLKSQSMTTASTNRNLEAKSFHIPDRSKIEMAFEDISSWRADAVLTTEDLIIVSNRRYMIDAADKIGVPVMAEFALLAEAGALMSYGPNVLDMWKRSATYVDKILKGVSPANLPIEQPTAFELVLNQRSADRYHLSFPVFLQSSADRIID